jgi:hypothetical protein
VREIAIPESIEIVGGFSWWDCLESVKFGISGRLREIRGFCECNSLRRIEIPASVELIGDKQNRGGFNGCAALAEVIFAIDGHLRRIDGFCECGSLTRVEIPVSVEVIRGFNKCKLLSEIEFSALGGLREIHGFQGCESLREVEIPRSVVRIEAGGFWNCRGLRKVTFAGGCDLGRVRRFEGCSVKEVHILAGGRALHIGQRVYITFEEEASIARHRRRFKMRTCGVAVVEREDEGFLRGWPLALSWFSNLRPQ